MSTVFKSFITEKEAEEVKKKRQEEWERVRRPDQPLERPEEKYDPRTLYERLKQQRDQKQEEWEDQFKFKNMIYKGLDDEEAGFLTMVAQRQADQKADIIRREIEEVIEYREAVAKLQEESPISSAPLRSTDTTTTTTTSIDSSSSSSSNASFAAGLETSSIAAGLGSRPSTARSQLALIAGSVKTKRRRSSSKEEDTQEKKLKLEKEESKEPSDDTGKEGKKGSAETSATSPLTKQAANSSSNALLGLGAYTSDSSDSED